MRLEAGIAWRYLWKKKSHGAVSAIAAVSVVGVAVATAALLCVLSVFNGFRMLLVDRSDLILPDIEVVSRDGRVISDADSLASAIATMEGVEIASPVLADQALAIFGQREMPVMLHGIEPEAFRNYTSVDSLVVSGTTIPYEAIDFEPPAALITTGVASRLQAFLPGDRLFLFAPRREGRINLANPMASFFTDSIQTFGIIETMQTDFDAATICVPIDIARSLLQYENQGSSVAVKAGDGVDLRRLADSISAAVGGSYEVRDRLRQQAMSFRMVQIEKWVTGLLLIFILVIASFNIISTMTMFVLEKRRQMQTLRSLGMRRGDIGSIFGWESLYITLLGGGGGLVLGVILSLLQERYGLLKMSGDSGALIVQAYPVQLVWSDLWAVAVPVVAIGLVTAWTAAAFARSRIVEKRQ